MKNMLIVDDSDGKIALVTHMYKKHGYKGDVLTAHTTDQAKELADQVPIDFAFVDYYVPSENGPTVIRYIKEKYPDARIALVTSADDAENFKEAKSAGAEVCICTSYQSDEVEEAFDEVLEEWIGNK